MNQMIAYCGLICTDCPAYVATQASDRDALENVAAEWREMFNAPEITADNIRCDGCLVEGRKAGYCSMCDIRACAIERGVINCAHCDAYGDGCEKLDSFIVHSPEAREVLNEIWDEIRRA
ncbi:MAG: DUF3795 domain-containing protein [Anaerolineales bacterium]